METNDTGFEIIPTTHSEHTMTGHGTLVRRRRALTGDIVVKNVKPDGAFQNNPEIWMEKVRNAARVTSDIRALNNPAYDVPRTYISHGKVYEEVARGTRLSDLPAGYLKQNMDWLIPAVANFMNDMAGLHPVKNEPRTYRGLIFPIWLPHERDVPELLELYSGILDKSDFIFINSVIDYVSSLPDAHQMVFSHNDLNSGNVFVDTENRRITFIDFELAGYAPKMAVMYLGSLGGEPGVWNYINTNLENKTNPELRWDWNPDIKRMYALVVFASINIRRNNIENIKKIPERCAAVRKLMADKKIKFQTGAEKLKKHKKPTATLVPVSHYTRD